MTKTRSTKVEKGDETNTINMTASWWTISRVHSPRSLVHCSTVGWHVGLYWLLLGAVVAGVGRLKPMLKYVMASATPRRPREAGIFWFFFVGDVGGASSRCLVPGDEWFQLPVFPCNGFDSPRIAWWCCNDWLTQRYHVRLWHVSAMVMSAL